MFNKYKEKIKSLENQIDHMKFEWRSEKELYDDDMQLKVYEQKVDFVIGGVNILELKEIHRPLYGLSNDDAVRISKMVQHKLEAQHIKASVSTHWSERKDCFVIDVTHAKYVPMNYE